MAPPFYLFALLFWCCIYAACASFSTVVNPGCGALCNGTLLAYSRLQRSSDSLHVIIAVGEQLGDLSVSYIQSSEPRQNVSFDWAKLFSNDSDDRLHALQFAFPANKTTLVKGTVTFTTLVEYDDAADSVDPSQNSTRSETAFADFDWRLANWTADSLTLSANSAAGEDDESRLFEKDGQLQLVVQLADQEIRSDQLPRLLFTGNNTRLELVMKGLRTKYANSRFAVQTVLLSGTAGSQKVSNVPTIDDEFTPGNFHIYDWYALNRAQQNLCYLQWKPVYYKDAQRNLTTSSVVRARPDQPKNLTEQLVGILNESFVYSLYGNVEGAGSAGELTFSFGVQKDKFYKASNYTVWTTTFGVGDAPADEVTALVIIVIACGLGLPLLLMVCAGVYLCVRRKSGTRQVSDYQPINA